MIKVRKPIEKINNIHNGVFLAGPCPRTTDPEAWEDWRKNMISILDERGFNGEIIDPTNENYDTADPTYYDKQCTWETQGMHIASIIVFWIDRDLKNHPAFTTNIEFGIWSNAMTKRIIVGIPEGSEKCGYIKWVCEKKGIPVFDNMKDVADAVVSHFSRTQKVFFTSDTHFGSERTLKFSKRPFNSTEEMDYELISNWNKVATSNDIVYHLGDFGNLNVIPLLQFKELIIQKGNYENDDPDFEKNASRYPNVTVLRHNLSLKFPSRSIYGITHEPIIENWDSENAPIFYLYGHIHEKGKVKRNGFNVGIDANNYNLVDLDTIEFYRNAILNHYDDNVFTEEVKLHK